MATLLKGEGFPGVRGWEAREKFVLRGKMTGFRWVYTLFRVYAGSADVRLCRTLIGAAQNHDFLRGRDGGIARGKQERSDISFCAFIIRSNLSRGSSCVRVTCPTTHSENRSFVVCFYQ